MEILNVEVIFPPGYAALYKFIIDEEIGISGVNGEGMLSFCVKNTHPYFQEIAAQLRTGQFVVGEHGTEVGNDIPYPPQECPFYEPESSEIQTEGKHNAA